MTTPSDLILNTLRTCTIERLQRATDGLAGKTLTVTLTRQTESEIRALVKNGDGIEYGVSLTDTGAFCGCPDFAWRGVICKHAVAVALHVLRQPEPDTTPARVSDPIHLQ